VAHLGSWELDFATDIVMLSDEACRIYGLTPGQNCHPFESWLSLIHPEDFVLVSKKTKESRDSFRSFSTFHRIVGKDGLMRHVYSENKVDFDSNGKPTGLHGIVHDVTGQKKAEENLVKSESSLREAQAIAHVGNWEVDLLHDSHYWSDEIYKIFGISKGELSPSEAAFMSFFHPDDLAYSYTRIEEGFRTFQNISFDFRFIRKDGVVRYGYNEWKFKFDKNGNPERLCGIFQDITERKQAETERTKMVNDLVQRNKDLEQFAYIVSHNLRAPVANILGASNGLNDPRLNAKNKDILRKGLTESVTRLDDIVKDLSYILQVKGAINEVRQKVLFSKLVDDIKISIDNLIADNNIEIRYDFSEMDEFLTLKSYLHSIFYNLILNSIKFRQEQVAGVIEIKSHRLKDSVELSFSDNGKGIDLEKRGGQVFGLYKRFHTDIEGKGMGLFMVKTQVETLGGKISVLSQVNKRTEFKIEFEI